MAVRYRNSSTGCDHPVGAECAACDDEYNKQGIEFSNATPSVILFRPAFYEHVSLEGVQCDTPEQLKKACADNGNTSVYLRDFGSLWRSGRERREL